MAAPTRRYAGTSPAAWSPWDAGHPMFFDAGRVIYDEGDAPDRLYLMTDGKVKIGREIIDGRRCLFNLVGPSEVFGEDGLLGGGPRSATATAMTPVRVIALDRPDVDAQLASDPVAVDFLLRVMARRVRRTTDAITDLMSATVSARVAKCLLRLAQQFGQREDDVIRVTLDLTQEQLAQPVGTSRESTNKTLADFAEHRWIRVYGDTLVIRESRALARHRDGGRRLTEPAVVPGRAVGAH